MGSAESIGADQRANLYRTKLTSLVRLLFPETASDPVSVSGFASGAVADLGDRSIVLVHGDDGLDSFGAGLIKSRSVEHISVWVDASVPGDTAGVIARCSRALTPVDSVEVLTGTSLGPAPVLGSGPTPTTVPSTDPWVEVLREAGLTVERSQGELIGSLRGLEAARIATNPDGSTRLDVGVGHYDQEAFAMMNVDLDPQEGLEEVVRQITELRVGGARSHPINRLGRTRWLASTIVEDPSIVQASRLERIDLLAEPGIRIEAPVALVGTDTDGGSLGVVVAVGLNLSMIPAAADLAVCAEVDRLILVVPARDRYALVDEMAAMLAVPTTVTSVALPWSNEVPLGS